MNRDRRTALAFPGLEYPKIKKFNQVLKTKNKIARIGSKELFNNKNLKFYIQMILEIHNITNVEVKIFLPQLRRNYFKFCFIE